MAIMAPDHPHTTDPQPSAASGQLVMHPAPCASCGQRPPLARWVLIGEPAQWVCSAACLKVVMGQQRSTGR